MIRPTGLDDTDFANRYYKVVIITIVLTLMRGNEVDWDKEYQNIWVNK